MFLKKVLSVSQILFTEGSMFLLYCFIPDVLKKYLQGFIPVWSLKLQLSSESFGVFLMYLNKYLQGIHNHLVFKTTVI